jgi:hypothetical protein
MLHIVHTRGRRAQTAQHFGHAPIRIGCAPNSDVAFAPGEEAGVMPAHAEIRMERNAVCVVDLGTPAGTFVNGKRVEVKPLRTGDEIALGSPKGPAFRVEIEGPLVVSPDGRVDVETAKRVVKAAVLRTAGGEDKTEAMVRAKVQAAERRAARFNMLLTFGVLGAFIAVAFAGWVVYKKRAAAAVLVAETGLGRAPLPSLTGAIPTSVLTGRAIYEQNRSALYVMGYTLGNRIGGCCSAFAVGPNLLATNAHCVRACGDRGGQPIVTQNESGGKTRFKILKMTIHPAYKSESKSADSPDVGLLRVDGKLPKAVTIASDAELRAIGPGDDAFVLGFPGRVMDPISPSATFLQGRVGRVTGFDEEATSPDKAFLIQHDAVTRGGNSGSPIFNQYGHVVGVHAAHIDDEGDVDIGGKKTTVVQSSPFRIGMRIDLLKGVPAP